jgi:hypothetical protein
MKTVRFLQKQSPYNAGEVAGFSDEICERYVNAKVAEIVPSEEPIQDEAVLDAEQWKQKFYDAAAAHKKERHDIVEYLAGVEKERDALKNRVADLEIVEVERNDLQVDRDALKNDLATIEANLNGRILELEAKLQAAQTSAKPEGENAAPAGPVDESGAPIDVTNKGDAGSQENAGGSEEGKAGGKKSGRK